jgi:hypothetical protein
VGGLFGKGRNGRADCRARRGRGVDAGKRDDRERAVGDYLDGAGSTRMSERREYVWENCRATRGDDHDVIVSNRGRTARLPGEAEMEQIDSRGRPRTIEKGQVGAKERSVATL